MRVLLVEDEEHKALDLTSRIQSFSKTAPVELIVSRSVRDAVKEVSRGVFDLVVLDMALPTFTKEKVTGETGGVAQASGGIEVIRMMQTTGRSSRIVIVTQYPDIIISGEMIKLKRIKDTLRRKYKSDVLGVVLYLYDSETWVASFDALLEKIV